MPRNSQGLYTLPVGNPVTPNTDIDSVWANATMADIATALTESLPRNGAAPMTGLLTLANIAPTEGRHAVSKTYVDSFLAYATGLPVGMIIPYAGTTAPSAAFLACQGQAVSRTTYAALFAIIGTIYGAGDGATTFNLPNLKGEFLRGRDPAARAVGSKQAASFASHSHGVNDVGHSHTATTTVASADIWHQHTGTTAAAGDHAHTIPAETGSGGSTTVVGRANGAAVVYPPTSTAGAHSHTFATDWSNPAHVHGATTIVATGLTGISIAATGGTETVPQNMALDFYIKALDDGTAPAPQTWSSEARLLATNYTNTTSRPIQVNFTGLVSAGAVISLICAGVTISVAEAGDTAQRLSISGTIPVGNVYSFTVAEGTCTSTSCVELK